MGLLPNNTELMEVGLEHSNFKTFAHVLLCVYTYAHTWMSEARHQSRVSFETGVLTDLELARLFGTVPRAGVHQDTCVNSCDKHCLSHLRCPQELYSSSF